MDDTNEAKLFSASIDEDASIELVTPEAEPVLAKKTNCVL
jgi:hypothetical protein